MKRLLALAAWVFAASARAQVPAGDPLDQTGRTPRIMLGPLIIGEDHPLFDLEDFPVKLEGGEGKVEAAWVPRSVKWVRAPDELAIPLARLRITVHAPAERALVRWRGRAVVLQDDPAGAFTELFVPLLERGEARVELDGKHVALARPGVRAASSTPLERRHAVDHSCSPYAPRIEGLDDAFVSINCKLVPVGRIGSEEVLLDVHWQAAGISMPDGSPAPLAMQLRGSKPARLTVLGPDGKPRVVEISARVADRWHRLALAAGAGPYILNSSAHAGNGAAAAAMLYSNLRLRHDDDLSLRFFESAVGQSPTATAFFNNVGVYFAYNLAHVWDDRLRIVALPGFQAITFASRGLSHSSFTQAIAPQGFEINYVDAFGLRGQRFSGGALLEPNKNTGSKNYWVRFGGRISAELNYISWSAGDRHARMIGLSAIMPFAGFF